MSTTTLQEIVQAGVKLTPMMKQYYEIVQNYPDTMVLFRMGDFYEVFFEDAVQAAKILNIARTHRGKLGEYPIPMAGIPHHAASTYIDRLTNAGLRVAICEQVQDPKDAKGIVKRAVTQVVSPGMPFDLEQTEGREHHYMAAGHVTDEGIYELVALDFTTGDFFGKQFETAEDFLESLQLISPKEFIAYMGQWEREPETSKALDNLLSHFGILKTHLSQEYFDPKYNDIYTERLIPGHKRDKVLQAHPHILAPMGALSYYVCSTQSAEGEENPFLQIQPFRLINDQGQLKVTRQTLTGLEILPKNRETYRESLLGFVDKTQTAMGSRRLKHFFHAPLTDVNEISKRQDVVESFLGDKERLDLLRENLADVRDLERILTKVTTAKATSADLLNLARAVKMSDDILGVLKKNETKTLEKPKPKEQKSLQGLADNIEKTLNDEVGASLDKGNLIREGASKERDRLAHLAHNATSELTKLEERYREETGIQKLRVKSNNVAGYFIEVTKTHADKVPNYFQRRQTLVNSERYTTDELSQFEKDMITAQEKLERLEREIFKGLIQEVSDLAREVQTLATFLSNTDVFQALAWIALQEDFKRPSVETDRKLINLEGAWHPLIKASIRDQFVAHDLNLNEDCYFGLITGPNMAGKTTVMREVAIIQLLAQMGSFTPVLKAELGVCDYIFSRLGASDDILKGQSTFMVEMAETAEILRHATGNSLIILDEVGRGTSTYDGLSIAWSLVEHFISETQSLTLFATHYHELIDVIGHFPQAKNLTVETQNDGDEVHFLYHLIESSASQSFGIYVGKLAGLPPQILERSRELLHHLEEQNQNSEVVQEKVAEKKPAKEESGQQLSFLAESPEAQVPDYLQKLEGELKDLDIMKMTPLEALQKLDHLKNQLPLQ